MQFLFWGLTLKELHEWGATRSLTGLLRGGPVRLELPCGRGFSPFISIPQESKPYRRPNNHPGGEGKTSEVRPLICVYGRWMSLRSGLQESSLSYERLSGLPSDSFQKNKGEKAEVRLLRTANQLPKTDSSGWCLDPEDEPESQAHQRRCLSLDSQQQWQR